MSRVGDHTRAEAVFRQLAEQTPDDDRASYNLALTLMEMGRTNEAHQWLEAALKANPGLDRARQHLEALDASARKAGPLPGPPFQASKSQIDERLGSGALLRSGPRRLSSFAGQFVLAALLIVFGVALFLTHRPDRLYGLAGQLTFPDPDFFRELIEITPGGRGVDLLQRELNVALREQAEISARLDQWLIFLAVAAPILGALLAIHALLAASRTRYDVYERRIDVARGVLNRSRQSFWLYEIEDVELRQPFFLNLTGNALIRIRLDDPSMVKPSVVNIIGFGTAHEQERLWEELTNAVLIERRVMKSWWV